MGVSNFTCVVLNGEMKVCQGGHWHGFPSYTGAKILDFLHEVDIERFKETLENTELSLVGPVGVICDDVGSPKLDYDLSMKVYDSQNRVSLEHSDRGHYLGGYETALCLFEDGELTEQELDDFVVSSFATGCDILSYIYNRSLDKPPLELFAYVSAYTMICECLKNPDWFFSDAIDGYYVVDLDNKTISMSYLGERREYSLDELPENMDLELLVFEKIAAVLWEIDDEYETEGPDGLDLVYGDDEKGSGGLWDKAGEIALKIGLEIKEEYPEVLDDPDGPIYAEDFGQEYIYEFLRDLVRDIRADKDLSVDLLVADANERSAPASERDIEDDFLK